VAAGDSNRNFLPRALCHGERDGDECLLRPCKCQSHLHRVKLQSSLSPLSSRDRGRAFFASACSRVLPFRVVSFLRWHGIGSIHLHLKAPEPFFIQMKVCVSSPRTDTTQHRTQCAPCWKQFPRCHAGVLFVTGLEATHASVVAILRGGNDCLSYDNRCARIRVTCRETESETRTPSPHETARSLTSRISFPFFVWLVCCCRPHSVPLLSASFRTMVVFRVLCLFSLTSLVSYVSEHVVEGLCFVGRNATYLQHVQKRKRQVK
jgi:hypothetical protein